MSAHPFRRRAAAGIAVTAALGAALLTGTGATATVAEDTSTPVPMPSPEGTVMSYLLNARIANPGQTHVLAKAVAKAEGAVVQAWPQIGVVVAHSTNDTFRADVAAAAGRALESVGSTRTVGVSEGTPADISTTWGHGASGYKKDAKKPANGDVGTEATEAVAPDPRESEQWDMQMIKADQAHAITDGSRNVVVGVLDSGIDPDHPDLAANIDVEDSVNCTDAGRPDTSPTGWYPTTSDHGTHVAGTIGAARNGVGIVGVAPGVRMAAVKVVNDAGFIYPEYAVCGFVWAGLHHMDVTNNSYYVDPFEFYCEDQPDQYAAKEAVRRAVEWSTERGVVHAAAAGNSAYDLSNKTKDMGSPDDSTPVARDDQQRLPRHPDRARRRAHGVVPPAVPGGHPAEPAVQLLQPWARVDRRRGARLDDPVDHRQQQRLRHQERDVDGVSARGRRAGPDEVGAPDLDARGDDRPAPCAGRRQGVPPDDRHGRALHRHRRRQQLLR